jgi:hypothetical protein
MLHYPRLLIVSFLDKKGIIHDSVDRPLLVFGGKADTARNR